MKDPNRLIIIIIGVLIIIGLLLTILLNLNLGTEQNQYYYHLTDTIGGVIWTYNHIIIGLKN